MSNNESDIQYSLKSNFLPLLFKYLIPILGTEKVRKTPKTFKIIEIN